MATTQTSFGYVITNVNEGTVITNARLKVKQVQITPTVAGKDHVQVTDKAGNELCYILGVSTRDSTAIDVCESWVDGLKLNAFNSTLSTVVILIA